MGSLLLSEESGNLRARNFLGKARMMPTILLGLADSPEYAILFVEETSTGRHVLNRSMVCILTIVTRMAIERWTV